MRVTFDHLRTARAHNAQLCVAAPTENERLRDAQIERRFRISALAAQPHSRDLYPVRSRAFL